MLARIVVELSGHEGAAVVGDQLVNSGNNSRSPCRLDISQTGAPRIVGSRT